MRILLLVACVATLVLSASIQTLDASMAGGFDPSVEAYRATIVRENVKLIEAHNRDPTATYKMKAYRQFISLTPEEVREKYFMDPSIAALNRKVPADFFRVEPVDIV